jgi:hypothetical protein
MKTWPPRYRRETEVERAERLEWEGVDPPRPAPKKRRSTRTTVESEPVFDVKRWRVPSRWRNDRRVGDVAMAKMLRGVDLDRFETLAAMPLVKSRLRRAIES